MTDNEVHSHGRVAAMSGLEMLGVITRCRVRSSVPLVAVARRGVKLGGSVVIYCKMKGHRRITVINRLELLHVFARLRVSNIIPNIAVTSLDAKVIILALVDGEMQEDDGVAIVDIGKRLSVNTCTCVCYIIPFVTIAFCNVKMGSVRMMDSKVEGDEGVATEGIGQGERRSIGALGVGDTVYPCEEVAGVVDVGVGGGVSDSQVERHHRVAACRIGQGERRSISTLGVGDAVYPCHRVTNILNIRVSG